MRKSLISSAFLLIFFLLKLKSGRAECESYVEVCDESTMLELFEELMDELEKQDILFQELTHSAHGINCQNICPESLNMIPKVPPLRGRSCAEVMNSGDANIVRSFYVPGYNLEPFNAHCVQDQKGIGSAWTVIFRRSSKVEFYLFESRTREEYKNGFGDFYGNHFLGLDYIHAMTTSQPHELLIYMEKPGLKRSATYSHFVVDSEKNDWMVLSVGKFTGDGQSVDSLRSIVNLPFSTKDKNFGDCNETCVGWVFTPSKRAALNSTHPCLYINFFNDRQKNHKVNWCDTEQCQSGSTLIDFNYGHMMIRPIKT